MRIQNIEITNYKAFCGTHRINVAGLVEMTIPEKPTSRMQKYRLTEKGIQLRDTLGGTKE